MHRTHLRAASVIIAFTVLLGFIISVPHTRDLPAPPRVSAPSAPPLVSLNDRYAKGVHTLSGTLTAPDACASVAAQALFEGASSSAPRITLNLTVPPSEDVCLMRAQPAAFSATVAAPKGTPVTVFVNGEAASTTSS